VATLQICRSPFIEALRIVVRALPFADQDRTVLLTAVEQCAHASSCSTKRAYNKKRPPRRRRTRAQLDLHAAWMRRSRAAKKAAQSLDA
jgi:hypothetical protein